MVGLIGAISCGAVIYSLGSHAILPPEVYFLLTSGLPFFAQKPFVISADYLVRQYIEMAEDGD